LKEAPALEKDLHSFNLKYSFLSNRNDQSSSRILKYHLLLEHYLDKYLEAANPAIKNWGQARLTFHQKLELVQHPQTAFVLITPGIRCVNTIRNRVSHNLEVNLSEDALNPIRDFLNIWYTALGRPIRSDIDMVEDFTLTCCAIINGYVTSISRHAKITGLPELLTWWSREPDAI
jgi:hypothetical protein